MTGNLDPLRESIAKILKNHFPSDTIVNVSPSGVRNNLHVLVVSAALDNMTETQKQEHLWGLLDDAVKSGQLNEHELNRISLVLPVSVDELRR